MRPKGTQTRPCLVWSRFGPFLTRLDSLKYSFWPFETNIVARFGLFWSRQVSSNVYRDFFEVSSQHWVKTKNGSRRRRFEPPGVQLTHLDDAESVSMVVLRSVGGWGVAATDGHVEIPQMDPWLLHEKNSRSKDTIRLDNIWPNDDIGPF